MKSLIIVSSNLRRFMRDRSNIFFVFIFPLLLILVLGSFYGSGFDTRLGIVAQRTGDLADGLIRTLDETEAIVVQRFDDRAAVVQAVERGELEAGLVLPADFEAATRTGSTVQLEFVARPGQQALSIRRTIDAAVAKQGAAVRAAGFVAQERAAAFDDALARAAIVAPMVSGVEVTTSSAGEPSAFEQFDQFDLGAQQQLLLFMFLTSLAGSAALIQTRRLGVARRMFATPTPVRSILLGEGLGRFAVALIQGVFIMLGTLLIFGVSWGDPLSAAAILLVFGLIGSGAAMLMGATFRNDEQAGSLGVFLGLGLAALGGCMVPLQVMELFAPGMWQAAHVTPHAWALEAFEEVVVNGGGLGDIMPFLGILLGYAAFFYALAVWRLRVVLTR